MKRHLSPSLVVSCLALIVALAGTATAALLITGKDVKNGSLTGLDVKDHSLHAADLAKDARKAGPAGPQGLPGAAGAKGADGTPGLKGDTGARGASAWDTIPSGQTVTGNWMYDTTNFGYAMDDYSEIELPAKAPVALTNATVNFATGAIPSDGDAACTGTVVAPTAPAGEMCIYLASSSATVTHVVGVAPSSVPTAAGIVQVQSGVGSPGADDYAYGSWAYTAP